MARTTAAGYWSQARARARRLWRGRIPALGAALLLLAVAFPNASRAQAVRGEASFTAANGFARLVLKLDDDVDSEVTVAGTVLVIRFKRPVDIPVDKLSDAVPDYVGSARRDPDGSAIRLALARKVTVNTMTAGERVFVDLMPDSWKGPPPALPQEVVRELAERARAAERALREQHALEASKKRPPVRVRASVQPTFVRYVFELPDGAGVSSVLNDQKLTLAFKPALTFDLADAKLVAPANVASIAQKVEGDGSRIDIKLIGDVDVHSFREEKNYIVDIGFQQADKQPVLPVPPASSEAQPAKPEAGKPAGDAPAPGRSGAIQPPTSQMIAEQAGLTVKAAASDVKPPDVKSTPAGEKHPNQCRRSQRPMRRFSLRPKSRPPTPRPRKCRKSPLRRRCRQRKRRPRIFPSRRIRQRSRHQNPRQFQDNHRTAPRMRLSSSMPNGAATACA